jgi:hypothetical protein
LFAIQVPDLSDIDVRNENKSIQLGYIQWDYTGAETWQKRGHFSLSLAREKHGDKSNNAFTGPVKNASGVIFTNISIQYISPFYRRLSLEIATAADVKPPMDIGSGVNWRTIFEKAGVDLIVSTSTIILTEPPKSNNPGS